MLLNVKLDILRIKIMRIWCVFCRGFMYPNIYEDLSVGKKFVNLVAVKVTSNSVSS
jgi:hypothetical protein